MTEFAINPWLAATEASPIAETRGWVAGRSFPAERPLINLSQAVPGYAPHAELIEHLRRRLGDPAVHRYIDTLGDGGLREAYAAHLSRFYGAGIAAGNIAITAGCNQAFCLAAMALARAGDQVILPRPHYFNHDMWMRMQGIEVVPLDFRPGSGALPAVEDAAALIGPRTRAIVLVTPNNPTGAVYPPALIGDFYRLAQRHGLALILDETYKDFIPGAARPHQLFSDPDWERTVVHLYSFSKVFALTGYRVGALTAGRATLAEIEKALDCIAICAPRLAQEAALFGLGHLEGWVRQNIADLQRRAEAFRQGFERANRWRLVSLGAYFAYVEHPFAGEPAQAVARRLADQANLLTIPGTMFGAGQERFIRFAFANIADADVPEVFNRLADWR